MPTLTFQESDKGRAMRVVHGKYAGRKGWKHKARGETERQIYLILQAVVKDGQEIHPTKVVRIAKEHCVPFERASTRYHVLLEQKPRVQQKLSALIKELCNLQIAPNEDMLITIGEQWLLMWKTQEQRLHVEYERSESPPPPPTAIVVVDDDSME